MSAGRPRKYWTIEEKEQAQREYNRTWRLRKKKSKDSKATISFRVYTPQPPLPCMPMPLPEPLAVGASTEVVRASQKPSISDAPHTKDAGQTGQRRGKRPTYKSAEATAIAKKESDHRRYLRRRDQRRREKSGQSASLNSVPRAQEEQRPRPANNSRDMQPTVSEEPQLPSSKC